MKPLAIQALHFALVAIWFVQSAGIAQEGDSSPTAAPKSQYGGFASDAAGHQAYLDYLHGLETIPVEAGVELQQAIKAIPVESDIALTAVQEAGLRDWLYDLLVAFSSSGSDSLAAAFYLREGTTNLGKLKKIKSNLQDWGLLKGERPFDLFQAMHRSILNHQDYEYRFGNVSFLHSAFSTFEIQGRYESYLSYARANGMVVAGGLYMDKSKLQKEVEEAVQAGDQRILSQFMFITEEPAEFAKSKRPIRTPFFFQLVWDSERTMWRFLEMFYNSDLPHFFQFSAM